MAEILGDVDDSVEDLRGVGGVQGGLGPAGRQLQPTLELELVAVVPHAHSVRDCEL